MRNLQLTPPGLSVLELVDEAIRHLKALPRGQVPLPRPLSFEAEVVHMLASVDVSINNLMALLAAPELPPGVTREQLQEALTEDIAVRASTRENIVEDRGGYLLWIWVFADPNFTRGSRRFPQ